MPQQSLVDIAKALTIAYNEKNWAAVEAAVAPEFVYDEVGTQRKIQGVKEFITAWRGWAAAIPDSKATFHNASTSGNTVVLEVTWRVDDPRTPLPEAPNTLRFVASDDSPAGVGEIRDFLSIALEDFASCVARFDVLPRA